MAEWLNTTFASLDGAVFSGMNGINCGFLNFLCQFISFFGKKAWFFIAAGAVLLLFRKTRKIGLAVLFAVVVGALFTNVILKDTIGRQRPYTHDEFRGFWVEAGANVESEFSFPSGHTTSAFAAGVALFLVCDKRWSWLGIVGAVLMAFSRVYLIVHYTTDVVAGAIVGTVGGIAGYYLAKLTYKILNDKYDNKFCAFAVRADVCNLFKKKVKESDKKNNDEEK